MQLCSFVADGAAGLRPAGAAWSGAGLPAVLSGPGVLVDLTAADPPLPADVGARPAHQEG
jgi:hypothetical protein